MDGVKIKDILWVALFVILFVLGAVAAYHGAKPDLADILFFMPVEN